MSLILLSPNLRFPGFEEEWELETLGNISLNIMYGINAAATTYDGKNKYIRITDIDEKTRLFKPNPLCSPKGKLESKYLLNEGDILFTRTGASVGKSYLYNKSDGNTFFAGFLIRFSIHNNNPYFIFSQTLTNDYEKWVLSMSMRSGQPGINAEEYKSLPIQTTIIEEQNKIANFLFLLDSRIECSMKTIKQLESQIQIFIDDIMEEKLKLNGTHENWKTFEMSEIGETFNGLTGKGKENFGSGKRYIQYKQIFDSKTIKINDCGFVEISKNENQNKVKFGDAFFTISSETPNEIGMSSVLLENVEDVYLNSFSFGFRTFSHSILNPRFASFLFRSKIFRNSIVKLAQGSTRYNMSKNEFLKLKIKLPSESEQVKIFQILERISEKLETENRVLTLLEQQKKYFLQNLFI